MNRTLLQIFRPALLHKFMPHVATLCLLLTAAVLTSACITEGKHVSTDESNLVNVGQKLPEFTVTLTSGTDVTTTSLAGRPAVVVLFNTGCSDCRRELPVVQQLYEEYADRVNFVCISREEGREEVEQYWAENHLTLPVAPQDDRQVFSLFALRSIPRVYVSDASLTVRTVFAERVNEKRLRASIDELLQ